MSFVSVSAKRRGTRRVETNTVLYACLRSTTHGFGFARNWWITLCAFHYLILQPDVSGTKQMICESVALPDSGARAIKYPLAKRNLGRRHRRRRRHLRRAVATGAKIHTIARHEAHRIPFVFVLGNMCVCVCVGSWEMKIENQIKFPKTNVFAICDPVQLDTIRAGVCVQKVEYFTKNTIRNVEHTSHSNEIQDKSVKNTGMMMYR